MRAVRHLLAVTLLSCTCVPDMRASVLSPCTPPVVSLTQVFVDTTGWAFTYPLAKLAGCRVACYTHYPTVSTNMLGRVWSQQAMYNNDESIRGSTVKSLIKVLYYQLFALVYGLAGGCAGERCCAAAHTRVEEHRTATGMRLQGAC